MTITDFRHETLKYVTILAPTVLILDFGGFQAVGPSTPVWGPRDWIAISLTLNRQRLGFSGFDFFPLDAPKGHPSKAHRWKNKILVNPEGPNLENFQDLNMR